MNLADSTGVENTYTEWLGSFYSGFGVECQDCHMPAYTGRAAEGGPIRPDVHRHRFVGVDYATIPFRGIDRCKGCGRTVHAGGHATAGSATAL